MSNAQNGFFDSLVSAVRENPLAAALIGGGALWLLIGNEKLQNAASAATAAVSPIADIGAHNLRAAASKLERTAAPPTAPEMDHDVLSHVGEAARQAGSAASDAVSGVADNIRDRFNEGGAYVQDNLGNLTSTLSGKAAFIRAQSSLADLLERQPLVLAGVGLAIGAVVAGAFAMSDLENEWVGELSDDVKSELNTRGGALSDSLREASDTLKAELVDTGAEAVDRLKQAGMDAADAAREKLTT